MNNDISCILNMFLLNENSTFDDGDINDLSSCFNGINDELIEGIQSGHAQMHTIAAIIQELNEPMIRAKQIYLRMNLYQKYESKNPNLLHKWVTSGNVNALLSSRCGVNVHRSVMVDLFCVTGNLYAELSAMFQELQPELWKHYVALNAVVSELSARAKVITNIMNSLDFQVQTQSARGQDPLSKAENTLAKKYMGFAVNTKHNFDLLRASRLLESKTMKPKSETITKMRVKNL